MAFCFFLQSATSNAIWIQLRETR